MSKGRYKNLDQIGNLPYNPTANQKTDDSAITDYKAIATLAGRILLIASGIDNTAKEDSELVVASILGLIADLLLIEAAILESREQQIVPGQTTYANNLKVIGTVGSLMFDLILFKALLIEVAIRQQTTVPGEVPEAGIAAPFLA